MYEDLREKAIEKIRKDQKRRNSVRIVGFIFASVAILLFVISMRIYTDGGAFWVRFPILILTMVYGIIYFNEFGFPFTKDTDELTDEEVEREMVDIYRKSRINKISNSEVDELELREMEELKSRLDEEGRYV